MTEPPRLTDQTHTSARVRALLDAGRGPMARMDRATRVSGARTASRLAAGGLSALATSLLGAKAAAKIGVLLVVGAVTTVTVVATVASTHVASTDVARTDVASTSVASTHRGAVRNASAVGPSGPTSIARAEPNAPVPLADQGDPRAHDDDALSARPARTIASAPRARAPVTAHRPNEVASPIAPAAITEPLPATDLVAEARALERARAALTVDPAAALAHADDHRTEFPAGQLSAEREIIAVRALLALGRTEDASGRAEAFVRAHPGSLYARRMRALLTVARTAPAGRP